MIKTYTKFLVNGFVKSFLNVFLVMTSLVFILNILKEIEFFSNKEVSSFYPTLAKRFKKTDRAVFSDVFPVIFRPAVFFVSGSATPLTYIPRRHFPGRLLSSPFHPKARPSILPGRLPSNNWLFFINLQR